jgi:hypothetical protein
VDAVDDAILDLDLAEVMPSSPAIMFRSVDLPQPEGPTRTRNSPSSTEISTRCSTSTAP